MTETVTPTRITLGFLHRALRAELDREGPARLGRNINGNCRYVAHGKSCCIIGGVLMNAARVPYVTLEEADSLHNSSLKTEMAVLDTDDGEHEPECPVATGDWCTCNWLTLREWLAQHANVEFDDDAFELAAYVQTKQDAGLPWGAVLRDVGVAR